jgi:hypothetical protein
MYGLVNKAIKDLVTTNFGEDKWKEICRLADHVEEDFIGMNPYPDKLTFDLVTHASTVLNMSPGSILEAFGEYWILYTADEGYGDLMNLTGSTFVEFLSNLDMLHYRINNIMPELQAPQFSTRNETENSVELEYRSHREGMIPMLYGLIKGLGNRFEITVSIDHIEHKSTTSDCHVFLIKW